MCHRGFCMTCDGTFRVSAGQSLQDQTRVLMICGSEDRRVRWILVDAGGHPTPAGPGGVRQGCACLRLPSLAFEEPIAELSAAAVHPTTQPAVVWAPGRAAKDLRDTRWLPKCPGEPDQTRRAWPGVIAPAARACAASAVSLAHL